MIHVLRLDRLLFVTDTHSYAESNSLNRGIADSRHLDKLLISSPNQTHNLWRFHREPLRTTHVGLKLNKSLILSVKNCSNAVGNR